MKKVRDLWQGTRAELLQRGEESPVFAVALTMAWGKTSRAPLTPLGGQGQSLCSYLWTRNTYPLTRRLRITRIYGLTAPVSRCRRTASLRLLLRFPQAAVKALARLGSF